MIEINKVNPQNPKWIKNHSESIKLRDKDPENIRKRTEGYKIRNQNPEWRKNLKIAAARRNNNPDWIKSQTERNRENAKKPEWQEAVKNGCAIRDQDPEYRKRVSAGLQGIPVEEWKGFTKFFPYCEKFNYEFKERVRAFQGHRCALCGRVWKSGETKLSVHHVHNHKGSCCDESAPRVFVCLCSGGCHQKTTKNWRHYVQRFMRYILKNFNGKSYYTKEEMGAIRQKEAMVLNTYAVNKLSCEVK
jgi:hypothetical protein